MGARAENKKKNTKHEWIGDIRNNKMKITKTQLKQIIKEELEKALEENVPVGASMSQGKRFYSSDEKQQIKSFKNIHQGKSVEELEQALPAARNELEKYAINDLIAAASWGF